MALYQSNDRIILASASPRRKELLLSTGLPFEIEISKHDESSKYGEEPKSYARRIAKEKAECIAKNNQQAWVIGADTIVVLNGKVYGKPENHQEAIQMLETLQGKTHQVIGAFAVLRKDKGIARVESHSTDVTMRPLSKQEIESYVASGEPMDKAGAYAIQGAGASFIEEIRGSCTNVVGLNLSALLRVLVELDVIGSK
ncbi:MAG: septum formation inhibitor Maf [SAR324 cluster bacterium]|uniref:dTTP/UTP pyrophosphatase n=1 Tax=SAR324 cluster bacterium TaxID=2024889 RepID=A0A7X9FTQ7_9DELT|nr:septum formation inhibitor Maf [SAR324 cluster bacterium]